MFVLLQFLFQANEKVALSTVHYRCFNGYIINIKIYNWYIYITLYFTVTNTGNALFISQNKTATLEIFSS